MEKRTLRVENRRPKTEYRGLESRFSKLLIASPSRNQVFSDFHWKDHAVPTEEIPDRVFGCPRVSARRKPCKLKMKTSTNEPPEEDWRDSPNTLSFQHGFASDSFQCQEFNDAGFPNKIVQLGDKKKGKKKETKKEHPRAREIWPSPPHD